MLLHLSPNSLTSTSSLSPLTPSLSLLFHSLSHSLSPHSLTLPPYLPDLALSPLSNYLSPPLFYSPLPSFYSLPTLSFPLSLPTLTPSLPNLSLPLSHSLYLPTLSLSPLSLPTHSLYLSLLYHSIFPIFFPTLLLTLFPTPYSLTPFYLHSLTHSLSLLLFFGSYNCNNYK